MFTAAVDFNTFSLQVYTKNSHLYEAEENGSTVLRPIVFAQIVQMIENYPDYKHLLRRIQNEGRPNIKKGK